jgi:hypothetical protein
MSFFSEVGVQPLPRAIGRAIVDDDDFLADIGQSAAHPNQQRRQREIFVINGNNDGKHWIAETVSGGAA